MNIDRHLISKAMFAGSIHPYSVDTIVTSNGNQLELQHSSQVSALNQPLSEAMHTEMSIFF